MKILAKIKRRKLSELISLKVLKPHNEIPKLLFICEDRVAKAY